MLSEVKSDLLAFFVKNKESLIEEWEKLIIISNGDPYKMKIRANGEALFNVIVNINELTEEKLIEMIHKLAIEVSEERVNADANIGDFVYNVNLGRSVLYSNLGKTGLEWPDLQESINEINFCFDKFIFFAASHYSEAKNQIIEEKTKFIDSTHQDRLTLLGQMTSSFIHEFRNPLTSIQGFIQLLKADFPNMRYLDIISSELDQLNFRISQFLLLSKKEIIGKDKEYFKLNKLIEDVLNFLYPSILDSKVKIKNDLNEDLTLIGYSDEIRQVFINIIFNAIDVLNHHRRAQPTISINSSVENNRFVKVTISNNGPMIPSELQKTIFEPFFTTKTLGTGLGLFVCKEIIEKHKGSLSCYSSPEVTTFSITLPINVEN